MWKFLDLYNMHLATPSSLYRFLKSKGAKLVANLPFAALQRAFYPADLPR
jgi:hypothetical protein